MNIIDYINRPEYVFQPQQVFRRLKAKIINNSIGKNTFRLPWGVTINAFSGEAIGKSIAAMGIYDLCVSESLYRIIDKNETCVDVGANIGYMTSLMAHCVGKEGRVFAFEPHPNIYQTLFQNIQKWKKENDWTQIELKNLAISDQLGQASLFIPVNFDNNQGIASLVPPVSEDVNNLGQKITVETNTLDNLFGNSKIQLLKLDVEGHEINVLLGAQKMLEENRIRDVLFEEHQSYPNSVCSFLIEKGYSVYRVTKGFLKPSLVPPKAAKFHPWEPPCYLATKDIERISRRFKKIGWQCIKETAS
jgi:FkbM family methyltransferase